MRVCLILREILCHALGCVISPSGSCLLLDITPVDVIIVIIIIIITISSSIFTNIDTVMVTMVIVVVMMIIPSTTMKNGLIYPKL